MTKNSLPTAHKIAHYFARSGLRGSSYMWRFARQLKREKAGELVFLPNGFPIICDSTDWISKTIYEGTYERPLLQFLNKIHVKGTFVDVGANIGVTLWHGVRGSSNSSRFIAIEPSEQCQDSLSLVTSHIKQQGFVVKAALGEFNEQKIMYGLNNPLQSGGASLLDNFGLQGEKVSVDVRALDDLLKEYPSLPPVTVLKVDTEGFEEMVLAGSGKLIASNTIEIYILEVSPSFSSTNWVEILYRNTQFNYDFFRLIERGLFYKRMKLQKIVNIEYAIQMSDQWNLIIIRSDLLPNFIENIVK